CSRPSACPPAPAQISSDASPSTVPPAQCAAASSLPARTAMTYNPTPARRARSAGRGRPLGDGWFPQRDGLPRRPGAAWGAGLLGRPGVVGRGGLPRRLRAARGVGPPRLLGAMRDAGPPHGPAVGLFHLRGLRIGVGEPVGRPDAVEGPAEALQVLLAQPVPV